MPPTTWYLLIHQLPVRPLYFRARIRRVLAEAGAVPLKKAVYALPRSPEALERLIRIAADVRAGGGEAFVCEATFTSERDAATLVEAGRKERAAEYAGILRDARALLPLVRATGQSAGARLQSKLERARARLERVRSIDHSPSPGDREARAAIEDLERMLRPRGRRQGSTATRSLAGRTWVTRRGLHVDRLACAWVVRRHIDPGARFRFANPNELHAGRDELTFDTPGGSFSHEAGRCSVETLLLRAGIDDPAVQRIAEIVHDIDVKDSRFGHPETPGIERLIAGIVDGHDDDRDRLERGLALFDDLYRSYRKTRQVALELERPPRPPQRGPRGPRGSV